jgi:hypothetical protein
MSLVDVALPLIAGIVMVACPQILFKRSPTATDEDVAMKQAKLRKMGYVLLGVAGIYLLLTLARP